jgi:uncharacterized protein YecE (DUF72 family)
MLRDYANKFDTVEVGETFRGIPPLSLVHRWRDSVPEGFSFALRVPQQVTHERRFSGSERFMSRFVQRVMQLGDRLGPLVVLMAPGFLPTGESRARFNDFVLSLPMEIRWAVEFRVRDWLTQEILELLRDRGVAVVWAEGRWLPRACVLDLVREPTADFAYVRWNSTNRHGMSRGGQDRSVETVTSVWPNVVRGACASVNTVYGYMSNRITGQAPEDVRRLHDALRNAEGDQPDTPHPVRTT